MIPKSDEKRFDALGDAIRQISNSLEALRGMSKDQTVIDVIEHAWELVNYAEERINDEIIIGLVGEKS
jgi:hypothetical protein